MGAVAMSVGLVVLALITTVTLLCLAVTSPTPDDHPLSNRPLGEQPQPRHRASEHRLRLLSRALFASRSVDTITLDCTLVRAEEGLDDLPPNLTPPPGLPFTLQLRPPEAGWFAGRVEELLRAWAEENRELVLELREDHGRIRTTIASGESSVYLELADAPGFASPGAPS